MSDLFADLSERNAPLHLVQPDSRLNQPLAAATHPPVHVYFEDHVLQCEQQQLYNQGPGYNGHELWVPKAGDWRSVPWDNHTRLLINDNNTTRLLSNICRHRQAIMQKGHGNNPHLVCPLHRWTYNLQGELIGAPHFAEQPCKHLRNYPLQNWRGLLFHAPNNIAHMLKGVPFAQEFDFSGYHLDTIKINTVPYNWKTFIEVYLEDYHVDAFHPGLGHFVDCSNLQWHFGTNWSVQSVGVQNSLRRPGTAVYKQWHNAVLKFSQGQEPQFGAIWFCLYPNIMVEWYPHVLVVSTLYPLGPQSTMNAIEFYYPEEICLFEREFVEAEQAAYLETAVEDDEIAMRMEEGRKALYMRGDDDAGPYQSPMEDGMQHFHAWYQQALHT